MYRCTKLTVLQKKKSGKPEPCKFSHRSCSLPALENYEYCIKHILEDKTSPFKTCSYVYPINGKKCNQPAPKGDRKDAGFCTEHTRKAQVVRQRAGGRHYPPHTIESLLASLSHYAPNNLFTNYGHEMETDSDSPSHAIDPFTEIDAHKINLSSSRVLDYVSESDSDVEPATLESVWRDNDRDSSDAESVDSQQEDPLKHAGTYTAEEVALIVKEKMFRLQTLYYDQFKRLQHVLKERKRKYYHALLKEKEAMSKNNMTTITEQSKTSAKELKLFEKLKALHQFHKKNGVEGVFQLRVKEKRNQAKKMKKFRHKSRALDGKNEGLTVNPAPTCKCIYTEGGVKCGLKTLPSSKYCRKHILEDGNQRLFRPCGSEKADILCQVPVLNVFENASCPLHVSLPVLPHLNIESEAKKEEKAGGDVKCETDNTEFVNPTPPSEETPSVGPGGDVCQLQCSADCASETSSSLLPSDIVPTSSNVGEQKPLTLTNEDTVMDDIMANVDVVEEVVPQNGDEDQSSTQKTGEPICPSENDVTNNDRKNNLDNK